MARRSVSQPPVLPGYAYVRPLGLGGFADVFLYEQDMPRRVVAVKVLAADAINPEVRRTFNAEADVMARLSAHPSILTIYQAGISADGRPYLATEFCPDSMSARYKQGRLPLHDVLDTGVRMAAALETAHRAGVLHRDIKPSNILITTLGTPVLSDFGIASSLANMDDPDELIAMSVPWSSPEVVSERSTGSVESEVWSLGATLYTLLASRSPFATPDREKNTRELVSARIVKAHYTRIDRPDVPPQVEHVLARSMAKDPRHRPQSMLQFGEELRWLQAELGLPQTPLDVSAMQWGTGVRFDDASTRGQVITTVNPESRRAVRAGKAPERSVQAEELTPSDPGARRALIRAGVIGGAIGAVVIAGVVTTLIATGILG